MSVVEEALRKIDWSERQLMVACSGGLDSTVLLHALVASGLKPQVLHVNYHLRSADSDADAAFVKNLAVQYDLPFSLHDCSPDNVKGKGINLQQAARDFRRQRFDEWKAHSPKHAVVLAHHADDQVETFFLQLFRGSGTFGLGGMHPERDQLIRPFLGLAKADLHEYALEHKLQWREDFSNASSVYLRNTVRLQLLPELSRSIPTLKASCLLLMEAFRNRQQELQQTVAPLVERWKNEQTLLIQEWELLEEDAKIAFVHSAGLPSWTVDRMAKLCALPVSARFEVGENAVIRQVDRLIYLIDRNKKTSWDFKIEEIGILPTVFDKLSFYLDPDKLKGELRLRPWKQGDRINSAGLQGSQLVSDVLKDARIPLSKRGEVFVLADDSHVLWIPGIKVGRTALAGASSVTIWKVIVQPR